VTGFIAENRLGYTPRDARRIAEEIRVRLAARSVAVRV
jgi:hypothetical protein